MDKPVLIISATDLGKAALEIFKSNDIIVYGFLDDDKSKHNTEIGGIPVLGDIDDKKYLDLIGKDCEVFIASDDNVLRMSLVDSIKKDYETMPVNAIHPDAHIAATAILHHGTLINQNVTIGAFAEIGNHCILHSGAIIDYGSRVGDFVQIGAGSIVNPGVVIEDGAFIGSGVTMVSGVTIGSNARVGAGSVVIANVAEKETVFGNPAKPVEK